MQWVQPRQIDRGHWSYELNISDSESLYRAVDNLDSYKHLSRMQQRLLELEVPLEPIERLTNQRDNFSEHTDDYEEYFNQFIFGDIGTIHAANCLSASLMNKHLDTFAYTTEFMAMVFKKQNFLKVIMHTQNKESVKVPNSLGQISSLQMRGWSFEMHIHNHPFMILKNQNKDGAGTTIPSPTDVRTYKSLYALYGLKQTIVTDGFSQISIQSKEFSNIALIQESPHPSK